MHLPLESPWAISAETVSQQLETDTTRGLTARQVRRRRREVGPNRLRRLAQRSAWQILWDQIKSPVVVLLAAAALAAAVLGEWPNAVAVGVVLVLNGAIGFFTELRARRAIESLQAMGQSRAAVVRDGREQRIPSEGLVPGDPVILREGAVVPADARLIQTSGLQLDESALTGESVPVSKQVQVVAEDTPLADRHDMAFSGTAVTRGAGRGLRP